eukprot:scaffold107842_cov69-Phaeocystis_antarctica.AAC.6
MGSIVNECGMDSSTGVVEQWPKVWPSRLISWSRQGKRHDHETRVGVSGRVASGHRPARTALQARPAQEPNIVASPRITT